MVPKLHHTFVKLNTASSFSGEAFFVECDLGSAELTSFKMVSPTR